MSGVVSHLSGGGALGSGPYVVCITSFLAAFLRTVGSVYQRRAAQSFLRQSGRHVEVFLPFYNWFDEQGAVRHLALQEFHFLRRFYGMDDLRVVHAGYPGQGFLLARFYMNPADPRTQKQVVERIRRELRLIQRLRNELQVTHPILYVLHCGRRDRAIGWRESFQSVVATTRAVLNDAAAANVCISLENLYSQPGAEAIGTTLNDIGELLEQVGREWVTRGVLGWTFDPSHALLAYSGNYDAIERDLASVVSDCVHLHVNHPRATKDRAGKLLSEWGRGDDYHAAPVNIPERARYWSLLGETIRKSRIPEWRTLTYEVNWAAPLLRPLFGGSPLSLVALGYDALDRFCNHPSEALDVPAIERYIDARLQRSA